MAAILLGAVCMAAAAGCGSIHVGAKTHTHIYPGQKILADDVTSMQFAKFLAFFRSLAPSEGEPLDDFNWNEAQIRQADELAEEQNATER